jgi:hypothetical protein
MKQSTLDRRVAQATGESVQFIRQRGFSLLVTPIIVHIQKPANLANTPAIPSRRHAV